MKLFVTIFSAVLIAGLAVIGFSKWLDKNESEDRVRIAEEWDAHALNLVKILNYGYLPTDVPPSSREDIEAARTLAKIIPQLKAHEDQAPRDGPELRQLAKLIEARKTGEFLLNRYPWLKKLQ